MNRHDRRASDANVRKLGTQGVSPALLQEQLKRLAAEGHQMRTVLCAIIKEQGRVRVSKKTVAGLNEDDAIQEHEDADSFYFEYKRAEEMVIKGGVKDGKANLADGPKETA